jgi:hypothetical protein
MFTNRDETRADAVRRCELGFRLGHRAEAEVLGAAAAAGQRRQRLDRRFRAAELIDQGAEGSGAHILAADQP